MKPKDNYYWWAASLLVIAFVALIGTLLFEKELVFGQIIYRVFVCVVLAGIGLKFFDEAEKIRATEKKAFEDEWNPILMLAGEMKSPMGDDEWHESLVKLRRLLSPYMQDMQDHPRILELQEWLGNRGLWNLGMAMGIYSHASWLKDRQKRKK